MHAAIPLEHERSLLQLFPSLLGIDEAGRGPWAGPLVVAGVAITPTSSFIKDINDSKLLSAKKREQLYSEIIKTHQYAIALRSNEEIDELGIGRATTDAMNEIIAKMHIGHVYIDGYFPSRVFPNFVACIIDGDAKFYSIAAASIIAKHTRDTMMIEIDKQYPGYHFASHKGYGTKEHIQLLQKYGVSPIHRKSFKPIKNLQK